MIFWMAGFLPCGPRRSDADGEVKDGQCSWLRVGDARCRPGPGLAGAAAGPSRRLLSRGESLRDGPCAQCLLVHEEGGEKPESNCVSHEA